MAKNLTEVLYKAACILEEEGVERDEPELNPVVDSTVAYRMLNMDRTPVHSYTTEDVVTT